MTMMMVAVVTTITLTTTTMMIAMMMIMVLTVERHSIELCSTVAAKLYVAAEIFLSVWL